MKFLVFFSLIYLFRQTTAVAFAAGCDFTVGQNEQYSTIKDAITEAERGDVAGKTICVKDNKVYTDKLVVSKSGQPNNPFTIKKHPDSATKPKIRDNTAFTVDSYGYTFFHIRGASHVVIEDMEIQRSAGVGIQASNGDYVTLKNITVHDTLNAAVKLLGSEHSTIDGCVVYTGAWAESPQCLADPVCEAVPAKVPAVVNMIDSYNTVIQNCTIFNSYGNVLSSVKSENTRIVNNTVYDSMRPLIHIDQASRIVIENNLVYNTNNPAMPKVTSAFYKLDEYYNQQKTTQDGTLNFTTSTGHDRVIRNNIFLNMENGLQFGGCENGIECVLRNDVIENNTFLNIEDDALIITTHPISANNRIKNNIFDNRTVRANNRIAYSAVTVGLTVGPNIWTRRPPTSLSSSGDILTTTRTDIQNYFTQPDKVLNQAVLVPGQVDPNWFTVKSEYRQYGADASRVGASTRPPIDPNPPTAPPTPTPSNTPNRPGDVDGDGLVTRRDYNIIRRNFGLSVSSRVQGDLNSNGKVDIFDFQEVYAHFTP